MRSLNSVAGTTEEVDDLVAVLDQVWAAAESTERSAAAG
jgi:hypothetical protein